MLNMPVVDRLCSWEGTAETVAHPLEQDHEEAVHSCTGSAFRWCSLSEHPVQRPDMAAFM